jgi:pyruvate,water dikinase
MVSAEYTRDYGLFRKLFLRTGTYLERAGRLRSHGDVFFLTLEEHDRLLDDTEGKFVDACASAVSKRKSEMEAYRDVSLPSIIYGDTAPPLALDDQEIYRGIPTSPGHFEGRITVVRGYDEFDKDIDGTILVIPFADVGWTPILTRAGAIVSESGGMLSHAAIVARELSIPSISSVDHACRLKDGIMARIDGHHGFLTIME